MDALNLVLDSLSGIAEGFLTRLPQFVIASLVIVVALFASKAVDKVIVRISRKTTEHRSLQVFFRKLASFLVWSFAIIVSAMIIFPSIKPADLLAGLGLGSVAIGFAFKDIFENFIAGMLILLREPFRLGDFIECEDYEGWVEEITIRDTRIRQADGQPVIMPNAMLFKNPVKVRTDRDLRRTTIMCGVAYSEDIDQARKIMLEAVNSVQSVRSDEPVQVFAQAFGSSSIDFELTWWTGSNPGDIRESRDEVVAAVKNALDSNEIEIPFPYRTLTFAQPLKLETQSE